MNLKKIGKVFTSKSVGTGPSSYKKKNLLSRGLTKVEKHCTKCSREMTLTSLDAGPHNGDRYFPQSCKIPRKNTEAFSLLKQEDAAVTPLRCLHAIPLDSFIKSCHCVSGVF